MNAQIAPSRLSEEEEARQFCENYGVAYVRGAEVYEVGALIDKTG
jgi:hypothetical protein